MASSIPVTIKHAGKVYPFNLDISQTVPEFREAVRPEMHETYTAKFIITASAKHFGYLSSSGLPLTLAV